MSIWKQYIWICIHAKPDDQSISTKFKKKKKKAWNSVEMRFERFLKRVTARGGNSMNLLIIVLVQ